MKIFLVLCLLSCVYSEKRVKRIVGGLKAAIPPPLNLDGIGIPDESESGEGLPSSESEEPSYSSDGSDNVIIINEEVGNSRITGVKESNGQVSFRGIRFAEPPLKRNRFGRPILYYPKGEIDATKYGSPCLQTFNSVKTGNEDCLFLNVRTPSVKATGLPVMFWIHGGGFTSGSGNQYGASSLVSKSVVVVTANYRLGSLGFLGSNSQVISGNSGLFDIRAAFEWTKRYISYFGGDPNKIFSAGQGHGASVASLLAQSSFTAGNVRGVIAMSGSSLSSSVVDTSPSETLNSIASNIQCSNEKQIQTFRCLQKIDVDSVLKTDSKLTENRISKGGFVSALSSLQTSGPIVEGKNDERFLPYFLNDNPLTALQEKKYPKVPLLIGTTKQETGKLVSGPFLEEVSQKVADPDFLTQSLPISLLENNKGLFTNGSVNELLKNLFQNNEYLNLISSTVSNVASSIAKVVEETTDALFNLPAATTSLLWNKNGAPVYFYSFEHAASLDSQFKFIDNPLYSNYQSSEKVVGHGDELIFLFELQTLEGKPIPEAELKDPKDKKVKQIFVEAVAEFLHSGKPKIKELKQEWPQFGDENNFVAISPQPKVGKRFRYCQLALWGGFVDKLMDKFCNFPGINSILQQIPNVDKLLQNNLLGNANLKILPNLSKLNLPINSQGTKMTNVPVLGGLGNKPSGEVTHLRVTLFGG